MKYNYKVKLAILKKELSNSLGFIIQKEITFNTRDRLELFLYRNKYLVWNQNQFVRNGLDIFDKKKFNETFFIGVNIHTDKNLYIKIWNY